MYHEMMVIPDLWTEHIVPGPRVETSRRKLGLVRGWVAKFGRRLKKQHGRRHYGRGLILRFHHQRGMRAR